MFLSPLFVSLFDFYYFIFFTFFASSFLQLTSAIEIQDLCTMQGMVDGLKKNEGGQRERERETDRQTDRQTDRERQTDRHRPRLSFRANHIPQVSEMNKRIRHFYLSVRTTRERRSMHVHLPVCGLAAVMPNGGLCCVINTVPVFRL